MKLLKKMVVLTSLLCIVVIGSGCSVSKKVNEARGKTECTMNKDNATKFKYDGKEYTILNDTYNEDKIGSDVGYVSESAIINKDNKIVETFDLEDVVEAVNKIKDNYNKDGVKLVSFYNVYKIKNENSTDNLAILVNDKYQKAILSDKVKDSDKIIVFESKMNIEKDDSNSSDSSDTGKVSIDKDVRCLSYKGKKYKITDKSVPDDKKGDLICALVKNITFDANTGKELSRKELLDIDVIPDEKSKQERENWMYGSVFKVKGDNKSLAVEINDELVYANVE